MKKRMLTSTCPRRVQTGRGEGVLLSDLYSERKLWKYTLNQRGEWAPSSCSRPCWRHRRPSARTPDPGHRGLLLQINSQPPCRDQSLTSHHPQVLPWPRGRKSYRTRELQGLRAQGQGHTLSPACVSVGVSRGTHTKSSAVLVNPNWLYFVSSYHHADVRRHSSGRLLAAGFSVEILSISAHPGHFL